MPRQPLTLTASLRPAALDARRGVVRLHPEVLTALALSPGDPVSLTGRRATAGIAALAERTASRALLYADDLVLGNLGIRGRRTGHGSASAHACRAHRHARRAARDHAIVTPEMLRLALLGKVVTVEDNVSLLPQDVMPGGGTRGLVEAARRSLSNTVGYAWTSALLTVVAADPAAAALVTMDTAVGWQYGQATHAPGSVPAQSSTVDTVPAEETAPKIEDLPGLRAQADQLSELLDLGFHHGEVLEKLGTTVTLGVLVTGPAGSGKSALVRAVAAALKARVVARGPRRSRR